MQSAFAEALLSEQFACPPGLTAWNGSDPARRFGVYRNNVIVSLVDALADTYPVVQALVGIEFFRAMAREFVRVRPPTSPVLALYGAGFAEFIEGFAPAACLPYLPDLARLELLRVEVYHALYPSVRELRSRFAIVSLWAAHQVDDVDAALAQVDPAMPEAAQVLRSGLDVLVMCIGSKEGDEP